MAHLWLNGHKTTDCLKFIEMHKMFHGKFVTMAQVQPIIKILKIIINVNVVDVNVITRNKAIDEQVFKDRKPRKATSDVEWEKEERLKKSIVGIIQ